MTVEQWARPTTHRLAVLLGCVLLFMWPALVNSGPYFYSDTTNYIRAADAAVVTLTGNRSQWSDRIAEVATSSPSREETESKAASSSLMPTRAVLNGRSIYYGALLYTGLEVFGWYGPVLIQAAIAVATITLVLLAVPHVEQRRHWSWTVGGLVALGIFSPLPFFVARLMPDAFTGIFAAAFISLIACWQRHSHASRIFLITVCALSVTFHTTHVMLLLAISAGAVLLNVGEREGRRLALGLALLLGSVAGVAQLAFSIAVERSVGTPPISPPFLSARIIADGPGYKYLTTHCPQERLILCGYLGRMPQPSDTMLWSENPKNGIFSAVPEPVRRELGRQDKSFYLAVVRDDPLAAIRAAGLSSMKQASGFELDHFNYTNEYRSAARRQLPSEAYAVVSRSAAFLNAVPTQLTTVSTLLISIFSLIGLTTVFVGNLANVRLTDPVIKICILLILAVLTNIVICGAFSTPHPRYLMRIIWLLPLAICVLGASGYRFCPLPRLDDSRSPIS